MAHDDKQVPRIQKIDMRTTVKAELLAAVPGSLVTSWVGDLEGAFSPMSGCLDDAH